MRETCDAYSSVTSIVVYCRFEQADEFDPERSLLLRMLCTLYETGLVRYLLFERLGWILL